MPCRRPGAQLIAEFCERSTSLRRLAGRPLGVQTLRRAALVTQPHQSAGWDGVRRGATGVARCCGHRARGGEVKERVMIRTCRLERSSPAPLSGAMVVAFASREVVLVDSCHFLSSLCRIDSQPPLWLRAGLSAGVQTSFMRPQGLERNAVEHPAAPWLLPDLRRVLRRLRMPCSRSCACACG